MAHGRATRFQRTSGVRRQTTWDIGPGGSVGATAASSTLFPLAVIASIDGLTVVRTRGELNLALSVITAPLDGFGRIGAGICIVSENAASVGVTAVPSPLADQGWNGWLWYWTGSLFGPSATVANAGGPANARVVIDSKAMRKQKNTDVMVAVLEVADEVGAAVLTAKMNARQLLKLS